MPKLSDKSQIREILETERPWSAFALGDLEPQFFLHSKWFSTGSSRLAIVLLYTGFPTPILLTVGGFENLLPILNEMTVTLTQFPKIYTVIKPDILAILHERYSIAEKREMTRMIFHPPLREGCSVDGPSRLGRADAEALLRLFRDGETSGEAPEWFNLEMLDQGTYFGFFEDGNLIAAGGTHVLSTGESIAGLGNIYTRRDRRRRGLAAGITSAIVQRLLIMGIRTIVLNVRRNNDVAVRVYERLGFRKYCDYYEAIVETSA